MTQTAACVVFDVDGTLAEFGRRSGQSQRSESKRNRWAPPTYIVFPNILRS